MSCQRVVTYCLVVAILGSACGRDQRRSDPPVRADVATRNSAAPTLSAQPMPAAVAYNPRVLNVNGESLTVEDVLEPVLPSLPERVAGLDPRETQLAVLQSCQEELVRQVQQILLYQEASKDVTDRMMPAVDRFVDQEIKDRVNRDFGGRQARFEEHLVKLNKTLDDARDSIRKRLLIIRYLQENLLPKIASPTRRELLDYYNAHLEDYTRESKRELFLIDIPVDGDLAKARQVANQARQRLSDGEPFEEVARELSQGIHAADGGHWGYIKSPLQGRYAAPSEVFFGMSGGQISEVIETDGGLFIVKAGEVQEASTVSFEDVQPELVERYRNARFEMLRSELLQELIGRAVIEPDEQAFLTEVVMSALQKIGTGETG